MRGTVIFLFFLCGGAHAEDLRFPEVKWITNSISAPKVEIEGKVYTNATIRRGSATSVIVRHDSGFFSTAWTNVPRNVRTNLIYHPPKEVMDFINNSPDLNPRDNLKLIRGELDLKSAEARLESERLRRREAQRGDEERIRRNQEAINKWKSDQAKQEKEFEAENPELFREILKAIKNEEIVAGMRQSDVVKSWGNPTRKNESVTPLGRSAQWVYEDQSAYLYFNERGRLKSWQISK